MSIALQSFTLKTREELPLRLDLRWPAESEAKAAVIVGHGFKGFKAWGFFPYLAESLARAGYAAVSFDFSHNGIGDEPEEFTRLDLFARNTTSREVADLEQIVEWVQTESPLASRTLPLGLLGHSRGAVPVMVVAAEQAKVASVVTWNGVGRTLRFTDGQLRRWEDEGAMEFTNARTGQRMSMLYDFVVDVREHANRFDLERCAQSMRAQHLILHGSKDMAVDLSEADNLVAGRKEGCELSVIEGGTHTFGAVHPFEGTTKHLEEALRQTVAWFDRTLV